MVFGRSGGARSALSALVFGMLMCVSSAFVGAHGAAYRVRADDASLGVPVADPGAFEGAPGLSVVLWVFVEHASASERALVDAAGAARLSIRSDGSVVGVFTGVGGEETTVVAEGAVAPGEWALVCASLDGATGAASVWGACQSRGVTRAGAPIETRAPVTLRSGVVRVGASNGLLAIDGVYGLIAVRDHATAHADFEDAWLSRRYHAPYAIPAAPPAPGAMGCVFMLGHAASTFPNDGLDVASGQSERAAVIGEGVRATNVFVYDRSAANWPTKYDVVRPVADVSGLEYASPYDVDGPFFDRDIPVADPTLPDPPYVPVVAPKTRSLVTGEHGLLRVMTSANSRAVKTFDGSGSSPGNYAHGFIGLDPSRVAGVINRPAWTTRIPWFGFDAKADPPYRTGVIDEAGPTDFTRFWGAAMGLIVRPGARFAMRCKPEGLIEATEPLVVRVHALRFPGASDLIWVPNKHTRQDQAGTDVGAQTVVSMDTTRWSAAFDGAAGDAAPDLLTLVLRGDATAHVLDGDACVYGDNASVVSSIDYDADADATTIGFERPFAAPPKDGETLRFGAWEHADIEHVWPGLTPGDNAVWRGVKLRAGDTGAGVVVFSYSAWRPGVDGVVWGVGGRGGTGYDAQMALCFPAAIRSWMARMEADVWLQMFAQQNSGPPSMGVFADEIRAALPEAEVVWLGDMEHQSSTFAGWHRYVLDNGAAYGIPTVSLLQHTDLGSMLDLYADGLRSDGNHVSQRGNERLASLWLDALALAALPAETGLPGDANGDGVVDFVDLSIVLGNYGQVGVGVPGDLNGDGVVDFTDFSEVVAHYGASAEVSR